MKLVPKFSADVEHTLSVLDLMISHRKDELDNIVESDKTLKFLHGTPYKRKHYYANDIKISQLRKEVVRLMSIAIPESYSWEEEK